jgi:hypothetical protein
MPISDKLDASAALPSKNEPHCPLSGRLGAGGSEEQKRDVYWPFRETKHDPLAVLAVV